MSGNESPAEDTGVSDGSQARRFTILQICNAYESGFGHGACCDKLANPYEKNSDGWIAYEIGYEEGLSRA